MTLTNSQKTGVVATVFFHAAILLLLLYMGFVLPYPPPPEEGFLVDFGNSATGLGIEEPSAAKAPESFATAKKVIPALKPASRPKPSTKTTNKGDEDLLTQNYEKTVAIAALAKKKIADENKTKLLEARKKKQLEEQQEAEEAREKQQQEAEEARIRQEKERKIGAINSRAKNAFGGGKTDNGSQSTGQGNTYGKGNQGSPDGTPGANQYGLGGGAGAGKGISFSLSGRNARLLPKPAFPGNEAGIVVVEVTVDKFGKVTKALPGIKGSNTIDSDLLEAAKKAALEASFNADANAPAFQKGTITYHFILQ
ncbi:MAG: cell envelope integrity protein TolA [Mariniphaga sp.]